MKKKLLLSMAAATILSSSITVCAAPQYMADGAVFDPEWYLEQYPDVAGWEHGTSVDALYMHYTIHGAGELREPFNKMTLDMANILPYQGTGAATPEQPADTTQPTEPQEQPTDPRYIIAVEGETYRFPSIHSAQYDYADCMVNITFNKKEVYADSPYFADYLAPYTLPGYEWRAIQVYGTTDTAVDGIDTGNLFAIDSSKANFLKGRIVNYDDDDIIINWEGLWQAIDDNGWVTHVGTFTVSQNGSQYPACQIFNTWDVGMNDYSCFSWYALVPESFNAKLSCGYYGLKLESGKTVENESSPIILFNF